jgi:hypothetical protein
MSWYHPGFAFKKAMVIPRANVSGGSDLPDFPVLVSVSSPDLKSASFGGLVCSPVGLDLLFTDANEQRELAYEVESYSAETGALLAWVRVPVLSASRDTEVYLYFGNPTITLPLSNAIGTWDPYFSSVWHLGNGVQLNAYDSSTNIAGFPQTALPTEGLINGGAAYTGQETIQSLNTGRLDMSLSSPFVLYGSATHDATLTTACDLAAFQGGTETSATTTVTGTNAYAEIQSTSGTVASVSSIPGAPTGKGWVYQPGTGTFVAGNWSASVTLSSNQWGGSGHTDVTLRFFKYSSGTYTSIGTINTAITGTAKTTYSFSDTALSSLTFGANDLLYVDLWWHDNNAYAGTDNPTVYVSSSSSVGVADDMQIITSTFVPSGLVGPTVTLSAWAKRERIGTWQTLIAHGTGTGRDYDFAFSGGSTYPSGSGTTTGSSADNLVFLYRDPSDTTWHCYASTATYTDTTSWHHYAVTYTYGVPQSATLYVDGVAVSGRWTNGTGAVPPFATYDNLAIGSTTDSGEAFFGTLDEVHISKGTTRGAGWIATEYLNQVNPSAFLREGETVAFEGNVDIPLIVAYGSTTAKTFSQQNNTRARGVRLVLNTTYLQGDNPLIVTLAGQDDTSGTPIILASWTTQAQVTGQALGTTIMTYYPGLPNSSLVTSGLLPKVWEVSVSPTTNEPASYTLGASLIV